VLTELLWPEDELESSRHKLTVALSWIRQQLEPQGVPDNSVVAADRLSLRLNAQAIHTDVAEFEQSLRAAEAEPDPKVRASALTAALALYRGPLLPGYYEEWVLPEQRRLEALYFEAVRTLVPLLEQEGEPEQALQVALRAVAVDSLREESHRRVIRLYGVTGQPEAALRQYEELQALLREELGAGPSEETRRVAEAIRDRLGALPAEGSIAGRAPTRPSGNETPEAMGSPAFEDLDPVGGAVPLGSPFYVPRPADAAMVQAIDRRTSIILIKGPRQVGKTSLLARALQHGRASGARAVCTDLELFNQEQLESAAAFLQAVARSIAEQLDTDAGLRELWNPDDGPNMNFRRVLRRLIEQRPGAALVWALDDVDRLFTCPFGSEIFALMRAWHNERALDPSGPWARLTLAIGYATEAHLFITDVNQSPFNVGTRLLVEDFNYSQVSELNVRYGAPLKDVTETRGFWDLTGGHPYLARRGLLELAESKLGYAALDERADHDDWIYGEHLRRIRALLLRDRTLCQVVRLVLDGRGCPDGHSFYRLRSAGILSGETVTEARPRCRLYSRYLGRHLPAQP
jgi:DNA-binding SARP family transcriptional activator